MKNNLAYLFALLIVWISACTQTQDDSVQTETNEMITSTDTIAKPLGKGLNFRFFPDTAEFTGTLKVEMFYGAPNYGECPDTDKKMYYYILYPDSIINVINPNKEEGFDITAYGVKKIQLAPDYDLSIRKFKGKHIRVKGTFYGKKNGHHNTDVLLSVNEVTDL
jgi:hypothetical protein